MYKLDVKLEYACEINLRNYRAFFFLEKATLTKHFHVLME